MPILYAPNNLLFTSFTLYKCNDTSISTRSFAPVHGHCKDSAHPSLTCFRCTPKPHVLRTKSASAPTKHAADKVPNKSSNSQKISHCPPSTSLKADVLGPVATAPALPSSHSPRPTHQHQHRHPFLNSR